MLGEIRFTIQSLHLVRREATDPLVISATSATLPSRRDEETSAIRVETAAGERIGWVPKKRNDVLARLMDAGKLLVAKVVHKELEDHWLNMRIEIFLKDA